MQLAAVEFARNVLGYEGCSFYRIISKDTKHPIIDFIPEQKNIEELGGTLRLGLYSCELKKGTKAMKLITMN